MRLPVVALWVAVQLVFAAPLARACTASPHDEHALFAQHAHEVVVTRSGDRLRHHLTPHSPPLLPAQHVRLPPPPAIASTIAPPRASPPGCARVGRVAGPRGPPSVVAG